MSKKPKEIQITTINYADFISRVDGDYPSRFCYRNFNGDYVFVHTSKRAIAEAYVKEQFGDLYKIREV